MSMLSKFVKKHKKALLTGVRVIAAGVTRGKSEKVVGQLKGIGAAVKVYKGLTKQPTKAEAAVAAKAVRAPNIVPISSVKATTMPGGAKLKGVPTTSGSTARKRAAVVAAPKRKKAAAKAKAPSGAKRKAPKGGKDFKALSASWKAAGKPGTWLAWVKSH